MAKANLTREQITELRKDRAELVNQCRAILDNAERAGRDMTVEEDRDFNQRHGRVNQMTQQIAEAEQAQLQSLSVPVTQAQFDQAMAWHRASNGNAAFLKDSGAAIDNAVACMFRNAAGHPVPRAERESAEDAGFSIHGSELFIPLATSNRPTLGRNVSFGRAGTLADVRNTPLTTSIPGLGGVTVAGGFMGKLEAALKAYAIMFSVAEVIVTQDGRAMPWPMLDDAESEGVQIGENVEADEDTLEFRAKMFAARKFTSKLVKASYAILRDSAVDLGGEIGGALGQRIGRILNKRATTGEGNATLMGIVNDATVGKTGAAATAFTMDELFDLQHSVDPGYREVGGGNIGWMMNQVTAGVVRKLKDGNGRYLWEDNPQNGQPARFAGDPVYINPHMANIAASAKPVLYGDFSKFKIRVVGKLRMRILKERFAEFDQVGFIDYMEADGALLKPSDNAALCPVRSLQMAP